MSSLPNETRRQHYIPRMLLKRFISRENGKNRFIWCIGKDKAPFETNINNVGVSTWFYGKEGDVEAFLSELESKASRALDSVLTGSTEPQSHYECLIPFLWLMHWRTKAIRDAAGDSSAIMLQSFAEAMFADHNGNRLAGLVVAEMDRNPESYLKDVPFELRGMVKAFLTSPAGKANVEHFVKNQMRPIAAKTWSENFPQKVQELKKKTGDSMLTAVRELMESGKTHPKNFAPSRLSVIKTDPGTFVLGDSCVFTVAKDGTISGATGTTEDNWETIYLPIAHDHVLVADREPTNGNVYLLPAQINEASAMLAMDHIFARDKSREGLSAMIGQRNPLMEEPVARALPENVLREMWEVAIAGNQPDN